MTDLSFIFYSLKSRLLNCLLSILLTSFGVSISLLIIQFGNHIENRLVKDGEGIDIVVGSKGSPLQLILSSIYHIDIPTGNFPYSEAENLIKHPQIKTAIPLALGDNWKGHRIVGTTSDYIKHYKAELSEGTSWMREFEVVIGSSVKLKINDEIIGAHGLLEQGENHDDHKYKVTGILKPTGSVLDRLIITSLDSVLEIHGLHLVNEKESHQEKLEKVEHEHHENEHNHHENDDFTENNDLLAPEITALLITTRSPIANINLPRYINKNTNLQAANPAVEIVRLTSVLGLGSKSFRILSYLLILIAALSIFSGLAANLENRMADLAVLRAIGYSKFRIFRMICLEGVFIVVSGLFLGLILGFVFFKIFVKIVTPLNISEASFIFTTDLIFLTVAVIISGLIAVVFPAYKSSKISVVKQLSKNI